MSIQENDLPPSEPFKLTGFPTLKFKPAHSTEYIDYQGDRSLESLIEFVEENAKGGLKVVVGDSKNESPLEHQAVVEEEGVTDKETGEDAVAHHDEL